LENGGRSTAIYVSLIDTKDIDEVVKKAIEAAEAQPATTPSSQAVPSDKKPATQN
jgi:ribosomal protein L12E/L44/L45/RPP1/RPP2